MDIKLGKTAEFVIEKLHSCGYEAYVVGGAVRDSIMGREVTDVDITTSAFPKEIKAVFSEYKVVETGIKHGTVTVIIDKTPFEITTFRSETTYSDSRHPDSVVFIKDLKQDLSRRDFTVNAIAYSPKEGIIDPFDGVGDIKNGIIRTVGEPSLRFREDALRILRALRFSAVLGFEIERSASEKIFELSELLFGISAERILAELKKLICGTNAFSVINKYKPVFLRFLPIRADMDLLSRLPNQFEIRLAYLCGNSAESALEKLHGDNNAKRLCKLYADSYPIPADELGIKQLISAYGIDDALSIANYRRAVFGEDKEMLVERIIKSGCCLLVKDLAIDGNDLLRVGIAAQKIGKTLTKLLYSVHSGRTENSKTHLLTALKDIDISEK